MGDGEELEEELVVDVPLDRVREAAREEIADALRILPTPADLQRDLKEHAREAAREESARSVREALTGPEFETRAAQIERRATSGAARAASEFVAHHVDALNVRARRMEARVEGLERRMDSLGQVRPRDGDPVTGAAATARPEDAGSSASAPPPEDSPSEVVGSCTNAGCAMGFGREEKDAGFKRCPECGSAIEWL